MSDDVDAVTAESTKVSRPTTSRVADRLALLRRQSGAAKAPANISPLPDVAATAQSRERNALPTDPGAVLRALVARRVGALRAKLAPVVRESLPGSEIAPGVRLVKELLRDALVPPQAFLPPWQPELEVARERLYVLDTETTGLAGGSGTLAFVIGAIDFVDGRARLRQFLLAAPSGESAMLRAFAAVVPADATLVTYNGKCFDAPLLATRCVLNRIANPLAGRPHLDLLHPTRKVFRRKWENCRLVTAEDRLLGRARVGDLPGSEAPRAFREWLRDGRSALLRQVVAHNRHDLISLAALLPALAAAWRTQFDMAAG